MRKNTAIDASRTGRAAELFSRKNCGPCDNGHDCPRSTTSNGCEIVLVPAWPPPPLSLSWLEEKKYSNLKIDEISVKEDERSREIHEPSPTGFRVLRMAWWCEVQRAWQPSTHPYYFYLATAPPVCLHRSLIISWKKEYTEIFFALLRECILSFKVEMGLEANLSKYFVIEV